MHRNLYHRPEYVQSPLSTVDDGAGSFGLADLGRKSTEDMKKISPMPFQPRGYTKQMVDLQKYLDTYDNHFGNKMTADAKYDSKRKFASIPRTTHANHNKAITNRDILELAEESNTNAETKQESIDLFLASFMM